MSTKNGECKICEINVYSDFAKENKDLPAYKLGGPDPKTFPCALNGCPYETASEQAKNADRTKFDPAGKWGSHFD